MMQPSSFLMFLIVLLYTTTATHAAHGNTPMTISNHNIQTHLQKWMHKQDEAIAQFGHISTWDTSQVTDLRNLFAFNELFNDDISQWDVSRVTNFSSMFWDATKFNPHSLNAWNMSSAETISCMFCGALKFNAEISQWDVSNVHDMFSFADGATSFNQDLSQWNVASVTNFREAFKNTPSYNQPKLCWNIDTAKTTLRVHGMFNDTEACLDNTCVTDEAILKDAGCSGAVVASQGLLGALVMGVVSSLLVVYW